MLAGLLHGKGGMRFESDLLRWQNYIESKWTRATCRSYRWNVAQLVGWLDGQGIESFADVTTDDLLAWSASLSRRGLAPKTRKLALTAARSLFSYLRPDDNPALGVMMPKPRRVRARRTATIETVDKVLAFVDTSRPVGKRNAALLYLAVTSGLRAAELCRLVVEDVDMERCALSVVVKGGDRKAGYFSEEARSYMNAWLAVRPYVADEAATAFFVSMYHGRALTLEGIKCTVRKMGKKAGIDLAPHDLRRGFAVGLIQRGAPRSVVQRAGRWSSVDVMDTYLDGLNVDCEVRKYYREKEDS